MHVPTMPLFSLCLFTNLLAEEPIQSLLPSEEGTASYISLVYPVTYCALIGTSHKLPPKLYGQPLNEA